MSKRRLQRPIMKARQMYVDQRGRSLESILSIPAQEAQYQIRRAFTVLLNQHLQRCLYLSFMRSETSTEKFKMLLSFLWHKLSCHMINSCFTSINISPQSWKIGPYFNLETKVSACFMQRNPKIKLPGISYMIVVI